MSNTILIIDDEISIQESISGILQDEGFNTICASSAELGIQQLETNKISLILLDIWLGDGMDGLKALEVIKKISSIPVIMISGHGTIETALQATRKGAFDFIEKPLSYDKIVLSVNNGLRLSQLENENKLLRGSYKHSELTGNSVAISNIKQQITQVAPTNSWVLIRGEHGTGKELVAQSIHQLSATSKTPMIELNCAAIPEELIESELFGHEKGSFTGALKDKRGKFDQADGGIIFLDEIGDMSMKTQAKILRILQEQKFERVGGNKTIDVNVRVLAATNKHLEEEIENGTFRADLFYRLNVVPIILPPLRDRLEDLPALVEDLLATLVQKGLPKKTFSKESIALMQKHQWPGNVRELRNFIERLLIMCPGKQIIKEDITNYLMLSTTLNNQTKGQNKTKYFFDTNFKEAKNLFEKEYLSHNLLKNNNNISKTAKSIGLDRSYLYHKIKNLGLGDE